MYNYNKKIKKGEKMGFIEDIADDIAKSQKFLIAAAASFLDYASLVDKLANQNLFHFSIVAAGAIGWQIGGFFQSEYIKDRIVYGYYAENGSYPSFRRKDIFNLDWTKYYIVKNFFAKEKKENNFYLNNFKFDKTIKNRLNLINKYLANRAEKKDLFYNWENLKGGKNLIIGSSGAGKSVFLTNILYQWLLTKRRAVVYDVKGEFTSYFYNQETDYILNFDDERGFYWNFFEDIKNGLKESLVIEFFNALFKGLAGESNDKFWQQSAANRFKSIFQEILHNETIATKEKMDKFIEKIFEYLEEVKENGNRTEQSIASNLEINVNLFAKNAMLSKKRKKFLITDFFKKQNTKLFLHNFQINANELTPFLTAFLTILLKYQLTYFEKCYGKDYTLYLIDEYLTFYNLFSKDFRDSVHNLARSFGILLLPAIQYLPKKEEDAGALFANIENLFVFKLDEIETIKKVQQMLSKNAIKNTNKDKKEIEFLEFQNQELNLVDENILKTLKKGQHITYILSQAILYKSYTKLITLNKINNTFKEDKNIDKDLYFYLKKLKENAILNSRF